MTQYQIKNTIDSYKLNAQKFHQAFLDFDFQGFLKNAAQVLAFPFYDARASFLPLDVPEATSLDNLIKLNSMYEKLINNCCIGKYDTSSLSEMLDHYESIPEKYRNLLDCWCPNRQEISLMKKTIEDSTYLQVLGVERLMQYKTAYVDAMLAKLLPKLTSTEIQSAVGTNVLTEGKIRTLKSRGLIENEEACRAVYDALGIEVPIRIEKTIKTAGVTYKTEQGESRQTLLHQLENESKISLYLETYIFQKAGNAPINAIRVMWDGKDIASIPQTVVDEIFAVCESPSLTVTDYKVIGGYSANASRGLQISFTATGMKKEVEDVSDDEEALLLRNNPLNV